MRVLLADDEPLARALLRTLIAEVPGVEVVAEVPDGEAAVAAAREHAPDLVFLDVDMPGRNGVHAGIEIAREGMEVIFVTAHEEHAVDAFDVGAVDYLLKPVRRPRLAQALDRARRRYDARRALAVAGEGKGAASPPAAGEDAFWIPVRRGTVRLAVHDIQRVEAAGDHVYFHTAARAYLHRITMSELEARLRGTGLVRVHRSAFIRPERVTGTQRHGKVLELLLDDGTQVPVGPRFRAATLALLGAMAGGREAG